MSEQKPPISSHPNPNEGFSAIFYERLPGPIRDLLHPFVRPAYIKCGIGSGGNQVWRIDDVSQIKKIPRIMFSGGYQIQKAIPGEVSFNIQYLILPDKIVRVLVTRQ